MEKNQNFKTRTFIDFKPAELRQGKDWLIVFYCKNPFTLQLERFRYRVPPAKNITERKKLAKTMLLNINNSLQTGWTPYEDATNYKYKKIEDAAKEYLTNIEKEIADGIKRSETLRTYKSCLKLFLEYNKDLVFVLEIKKNFMVNYLDYLYNERKNSPRTYNNVLKFFNTFFNWCISKDYLQDNPVKGILPKKKTTKIRTVVNDFKTIIENELQKNNAAYYTLCMCTYYCFIRRTELTKLKVKDFNLQKNIISLSADISKNGKNENVTIPASLKNLLENHLKNANANDYIFSSENFTPGTNYLQPKKISDEWSKLRKKLKLPETYQFYSLKDTGITDLFNAGVPSIKIRNQARHHDLKITEIYTHRNDKADDDILNSEVKF